MKYVSFFFSGVNLKNSDLEGSQLGNVNLRVATLKGANLQNCILRGAVLAGADLEVRYESALVFVGTECKVIYVKYTGSDPPVSKSQKCLTISKLRISKMLDTKVFYYCNGIEENVKINLVPRSSHSS